MIELVEYLRGQADSHTKSVASRDPLVSAHALKLRRWALEVETLATHPVAPAAVAPNDERPASSSKYTHPGCEVCACPNSVCQAERAPDVADNKVILSDLDLYIGSSDEKSVRVPRRLLVDSRAALAAPTPTVAADAAAPSEAAFALQALVAAGYVAQAKVDEALRIARTTPGVAQPDERAAFGWPWGPQEPTTKMLREMAYELKLVPQGEVVCVQFIEVLRKQYKAAFNAARAASQATVKGDERVVKVSAQGVQFGKYFWVSHEKLTGCSADELNSEHCGGVSGKAYIAWLNDPASTRAAAPYAALTDEQIDRLIREYRLDGTDSVTMFNFARALLARNGGSDEPA